MARSAMTQPEDRAAPVGETERRIRRPFPPLVLFLVFMVGLAVVALIGNLRRQQLLTGLPDDAALHRAAELMHASVRAASDGLRFSSALTGELPGVREGRSASQAAARLLAAFLIPRSSRDAQRIHEAVALIERSARDSREPRLLASLACADLILGTLPRAERGYRGVLDRVPAYGEARLGLGMVLASRAERRSPTRAAEVQAPGDRPVRGGASHGPGSPHRALRPSPAPHGRGAELDEARRLAARYRRRCSRGIRGVSLPGPDRGRFTSVKRCRGPAATTLDSRDEPAENTVTRPHVRVDASASDRPGPLAPPLPSVRGGPP